MRNWVSEKPNPSALLGLHTDVQVHGIRPSGRCNLVDLWAHVSGVMSSMRFRRRHPQASRKSL